MKWQRLLIIGPYLLIVAVAFFGLHEQEARVTAINQDRTEAKFRDCRAYDDVGHAIEAGITVLTEQMGARPQTPEEQQALAQFIAKYTAAVDGQITRAKLNKGYSADCRQVGG
jgi:hypothetical protein